MRLSVELVPRSTRDFSRQLTELASLACDLVAAGFDTVNVPSAPRYGLDAVDACHAVHARRWHGIPHLRSMDHHRSEVPELAQRLRDTGVRELLVVAGDPPTEGTPRAATTPAELLTALASELPAVRRYAAFDPNRRPDNRGLDGIRAKLDAGAEGFFGQPAFDPEAMARWGEALEGLVGSERIWWGASPVVSDRSRAWWERVNGVEFPAGFTPTWSDWDARLPALAATARELGGQLYVMPIRAPIAATLGPLVPSEAFHEPPAVVARQG